MGEKLENIEDKHPMIYRVNQILHELSEHDTVINNKEDAVKICGIKEWASQYIESSKKEQAKFQKQAEKYLIAAAKENYARNVQNNLSFPVTPSKTNENNKKKKKTKK